MKRLIVNADDFGLHTEINKGIIKGYQEGFITSTSLMVSAPAFAEAVALAKANPQLGIGVHITLVGGVKPVLPQEEIKSLLDAEGNFLPDYVAFAKRFYTGGVKRRELEKEVRAQFAKALDSGLEITHFDSHQHTHILPGVGDIILGIAQEYGMKKMRLPREPYGFTGGFTAGVGRKIGRAGLTFCANLIKDEAKLAKMKFPHCFFGMLAGGNLNPELVGNILRALPEGTSEIMTHPGLNTDILSQSFTWQYHWQDELAAYLDAENKSLIKEQGIKLISFAEL